MAGPSPKPIRSTGRISATASSMLRTVGMHPLSHLHALTTAFDPASPSDRGGIHDFRLYPHRGCVNHNDWDTFLFPDNGAWRMAATPLGRHFPIPACFPLFALRPRDPNKPPRIADTSRSAATRVGPSGTRATADQQRATWRGTAGCEGDRRACRGVPPRALRRGDTVGRGRPHVDVHPPLCAAYGQRPPGPGPVGDAIDAVRRCRGELARGPSADHGR